MKRNDANARIERLIDLWNAHDLEGIADLYANHRHRARRGDPDDVASGRDGIIARTRMILDGFSDARLELQTRLIESTGPVHPASAGPGLTRAIQYRRETARRRWGPPVKSGCQTHSEEVVSRPVWMRSR